MTRIATTAIVLLLAVLGAPGVHADDKPESALPPRAVTHHSMMLGGHRVDYDAIAEALPLTDQDRNHDRLDLYGFVSRCRAGRRRTAAGQLCRQWRPGSRFGFSASGSDSGQRFWIRPPTGDAPTPPVRLVDNPSTWLPFTDLVFIDPVGTGYSRGEGSDKNPDAPFWDVETDLSSLDAVIRLWLTRHRRWESPVYLVGESYGGFRAAAMAERLPRDADVTVSGLVLISPALDLSILHPSERDVLAAGFFLPTYAATAAALGVGRRPRATSARSSGLRSSDYLVGLAGLAGPAAARRPVCCSRRRDDRALARHRAAAIGRASRTTCSHDEILRPRGEMVSLYDGTIARPAPSDQHDHAGDPLLRPIAAAFGTAFNALCRRCARLPHRQPYRVLSGDVVRHWDWQGEHREGGPGLALTSLEAALLTHPETKVLIANGRYDLVTPYLSSRWFVDQLQVPTAVRGQIRLRVYPGGHMLYLRPTSRAALAEDAARLYAAPGAPPPSQ